MNTRFYLFILIIGTLLASCAQQAPKPSVAQVEDKKPVMMEPFRFHKMIEVSPGDDFDVFSWGRGAKDVGSFIILHSDSSSLKYTTTTGDLDGAIVDVYNSDMDVDGNPEILIQAKATDTTNYAVIYAFEFSNDKAQKLDFPKLSSSQKKGYRGNDNFYIRDGKFMREFPIYNGNGKTAKPTGAKRLLQYGLKNNEFTVQQLSKDSTAKVAPKPGTTNSQPVKAASGSSGSSAAKKSSNSSSSSSKKKKHKSEEHTSHKKKHHHHSED